ncbi:MAG: PIN domain nuclease, partial [Bacillota bacterium]|nr:PIN domain nuclease [Bacillota bacterium]
ILDSFWGNLSVSTTIIVLAAAVILIGIIVFIISPYLARAVEALATYLVARIGKISVWELMGGSIGLIVGLFVASLIGSSLNHLAFGPYITIILSLFLGYVGFWVGRGKQDEIGKAIYRTAKAPREKTFKKEHRTVAPAILDTSAIIDGRIADIYRTGFIESPLLLPNFVLDELKRVADSPDPMKKNRGRRGMDILSELQKDYPNAITMVDKDYEEIKEVDIKIIRLAVEMKARIYTNDYNLNKMAQVQNVTVMNVNDLANAVKTVVLPGEEIITRVLKEGKEADQGIAYLDDGTMIVVEGGRAFVGVTLTVVVTSVLQTSAGRMIFAKAK